MHGKDLPVVRQRGQKVVSVKWEKPTKHLSVVPALEYRNQGDLEEEREEIAEAHSKKKFKEKIKKGTFPPQKLVPIPLRPESPKGDQI